MSKEAEILRTCISCHDTHLCQKASKSRGVMYLRCVSLTKVTLDNLIFQEIQRSLPFPSGQSLEKNKYGGNQ